MKRLHVLLHCVLTEEFLGAAPPPTVHSDFIESKAPKGTDTQDEREAVQISHDIARRGKTLTEAAAGLEVPLANSDEAEQEGVNPEKRQMTTLYRASKTAERKTKGVKEGDFILFNYQIRGFLKEAGKAMNRVEGSITSKTRGFKQIISDTMQIQTRHIKLNVPEGTEKAGECQRVIRINGPAGERTALASSETLPEGTWFDVDIMLLEPKHHNLLIELLTYGIFKGLGQWRSGGKGSFGYEVTARKIEDFADPNFMSDEQLKKLETYKTGNHEIEISDATVDKKANAKAKAKAETGAETVTTE